MQTLMKKTQQKKKYLIELGVNLARTGDNDHSCEGHYHRQIERYSKGKDVFGSIVVVIYTNSHKGKYFWPEKDHDQVQYIVVEHFLETNPRRIIVYLSRENSVELEIPQQ